MHASTSSLRVLFPCHHRSAANAAVLSCPTAHSRALTRTPRYCGTVPDGWDLHVTCPRSQKQSTGNSPACAHALRGGRRIDDRCPVLGTRVTAPTHRNRKPSRCRRHVLQAAAERLYLPAPREFPLTHPRQICHQPRGSERFHVNVRSWPDSRARTPDFPHRGRGTGETPSSAGGQPHRTSGSFPARGALGSVCWIARQDPLLTCFSQSSKL